MLSYVGWRFVRMLSVVFAVTLFSFLLLNLLPGSPINAILGPAAGDPVARSELTNQLGLNHPIFLRYFIWLGHALQGNLGQSYVSDQSVTSAIAQRVPLTLELMIMGEVISLGIAIPMAMLCSLRPDGWFDRLTSGSTLLLLALPAFILGPTLIYVFAIRFHVFPASGETTWFTLGSGTSPTIVATPQSILLPAIVLSAGQLALFARVLRGDLLATLKSEFILMARSKGFSRWYVLLHHALRPSSFSLMSLVGLSVGGLLAGALIVENVFALPGMGTLLITAIEKRDYLIVQGMVVLIASGFVTVNFITDALYGVLDPRVRRARLIG
ncbi:MAG TPA: ABC transporter permease [Acidimicrobiales bacterium]|nr:ABC transporter permease [Acidimicrobiales bacterium]